jgi:hypothetical protein
VEPGGSREIRLRLRAGDVAGGLGASWESTMTDRAREADEFFAALLPSGVDADRARVVRQAVAGLMWGKQLFHYDVARWLEGDPAGPVPPAARLSGRNSAWWHLNNHDVISMPDPWEYPWFAAWDLAFHCVPLAHVDAAFAKRQLLLLLREWYMHPNGQLPAYEWELGDVNPPVHAWAALKVFQLDGSRDFEFLSKVFQKLLLNFTWWVNRKDTNDNNVFEGGFLGLDNIGPLDRSKLPDGVTLEQSDGTAWMAMFCLNMLEIALVLAEHDDAYEDMTTKFFEHFCYIGAATYAQGLWDEEDGFFYDVLQLRDGSQVPMRVRSLVGLLPLCATTTLGEGTLARLPWFTEHMRWFIANRPEYADVVRETHERDGAVGRLLAVVAPVHLPRLLARVLDETEFLSPYGIRSLSARHHDEPFTVDVGGSLATVDYEPAESSSPLYGGNSNWRGPVWFPVNYLIVEAVRRFARFYGDDLLVEHPTGSGRHCTLSEVADDLADRLVRLFLDDADGRRPVFGGYELFQRDPHWHDLLPFHEYFHGDTGAGLGASHQTGWTALVADLVLRPHG